MPLQQEADRLSYLADFEDLPLDLQAVALRRLIEMARAAVLAQKRDLRIRRAWYELDFERAEGKVRIIE